MKNYTLILILFVSSGLAETNKDNETIFLSCKNNFTIEHKILGDERTNNNASEGLIINKAKKIVSFGASTFDGFVMNPNPFSDFEAKWHDRGTQIFWNIYDKSLGGRRWHLTLDTVSGNLDYVMFSHTEHALTERITSNYTCSKTEKLF